MTKKDYVMLAKIFHKYMKSLQTYDYKVTGKDLVREIIMDISSELKKNNDRFDSDRFLAFCILGTDK